MRLRIKLRRRREGKTDYKAREALLKAGKVRLVLRKSNLYVIAQLVKSKEAQDWVIAGVHSKELSKLGWSGCFKNLAACYLVGLLIAKKAKQAGIDEAIADFGLHRSTRGSRLYAIIAGALKGGLKVPCKLEMLPQEERIKGKNAELLAAIEAKLK